MNSWNTKIFIYQKIKSIILCSLLLFILTGLSNATTFSVGDQELEIPPPKGFCIVTQEMGTIYRIDQQQQLIDSTNNQLAFYIAKSDVPIAKSGEYPPSERYYLIKVFKKLKDKVVSFEDFIEFKKVLKHENKEAFKSLEIRIPDLQEKISSVISKEFDIDFIIKLPQIVPLDPHYETDNIIAYSVYVKSKLIIEESKEIKVFSVTNTLINVGGKILFLYCYGEQEDLEWTRSASRNWAEIIIANNDQPPSHSSDIGDFNWSGVAMKGISGTFIGAIYGLGYWLYSKFKKKKKINE